MILHLTKSMSSWKRYLTKDRVFQIFKYLAVSVGMYIAIFSAMYVLVDMLGVPEINAFVTTYLVAYIADYLINLNFLFYKDHSWWTVLKFILHIAFFLVCGSLVFQALINLKIHYLLSTFFTALVLLPPRFLAHKLIVFK